MRGTYKAGLAALLVATGLMSAGCGGAAELPRHANSWLSYKFSQACDRCPDLKDNVEAINYYCAIGVDPPGCAKTPPDPHLNLYDWAKPYFYPGPGDPFPSPNAIYANLGDLRIGRDMYCTQAADGSVACFVSNFGPAPYNPALKQVNCLWAACDGNDFPFYNFPSLDEAVQEGTSYCNVPPCAIHPFATVAMTFTPDPGGGAVSPNAVKFLAFDKDGNLLTDPALDGEGEKTNPRMCMACHGGTYNVNTHSVSGASFLPFDVWYFQYGKGNTLDDVRQEQFRQLNAMVKAINVVQQQTPQNPTPPITAVIDAMYPTGVENPASKAVDGQPPEGWKGHDVLYNSVVRQYCRTCHLASTTFDFGSFEKFEAAATIIEHLVCETHDMPHAEVPTAMFWKDAMAQKDLRDFLIGQGIADLHDCK